MNRDITEFISSELATRSLHISDALRTDQVSIAESETRTRLSDMVSAANVEFYDWRGCHEDTLWGYGVELVQNYLAEQITAGASGFAHAAWFGFHPQGSHFDCLVMRLLVQELSGVHAFAAHSCGKSDRGRLSQEAERFELARVIYRRPAQLTCVETIFRTYDSYFHTVRERFGQKIADEVLPLCVDMFRRDIGQCLPLFRAPWLSHQDEWLATAMNPSPESTRS